MIVLWIFSYVYGRILQVRFCAVRALGGWSVRVKSIQVSHY